MYIDILENGFFNDDPINEGFTKIYVKIDEIQTFMIRHMNVSADIWRNNAPYSCIIIKFYVKDRTYTIIYDGDNYEVNAQSIIDRILNKKST